MTAFIRICIPARKRVWRLVNLWIRHHITNKATPLLPFFLVLYSIAATAQANGLNTELYLTELFSQPAGTISLPFNT